MLEYLESPHAPPDPQGEPDRILWQTLTHLARDRAESNPHATTLMAYVVGEEGPQGVSFVALRRTLSGALKLAQRTYGAPHVYRVDVSNWSAYVEQISPALRSPWQEVLPKNKRRS